MTKKEIIALAHKTAKEKGFWDKERNIGEALMLCITELAEAVEAHRKGRHTPADPVEMKDIKDTVVEELADVYIRVSDLAGFIAPDYKPVSTNSYPDVRDYTNFAERCLFICKLVDESNTAHLQRHTATEWDSPFIYYLHRILTAIELLAFDFDFPLMRCIKIKMQYNPTRPYKHGKEY